MEDFIHLIEKYEELSSVDQHAIQANSHLYVSKYLQTKFKGKQNIYSKAKNILANLSKKFDIDQESLLEELLENLLDEKNIPTILTSKEANEIVSKADEKQDEKQDEIRFSGLKQSLKNILYDIYRESAQGNRHLIYVSKYDDYYEIQFNIEYLEKNGYEIEKIDYSSYRIEW